MRRALVAAFIAAGCAGGGGDHGAPDQAMQLDSAMTIGDMAPAQPDLWPQELGLSRDASLDLPAADFAQAAPKDLFIASDFSIGNDFALIPPDLSVLLDLTPVSDLAPVSDSAVGADLASAADMASRPNYVFVTSTTYSVATFAGDLKNADAECSKRAQAGNLPGTYVAYLSIAQNHAFFRLGGKRGWMRPDGKLFLDQSTDLAKKVYYPPRLDEFGNDAIGFKVATGTWGSGFSGNPNNCKDYTSSSPNDSMLYGSPSAGAGSWVNFSDGPCNQSYHLYCFEVDYSVVPTLPSATGRIAFFSTSAFNPNSGADYADTKCAIEATAASLPGTYKALLSNASMAAASRFNTTQGTQPWVRVDGVPIVKQASDLVTAKLIAPINVAVDGKQWDGPYYFAWSGSDSPNLAGTSCKNWTSNDHADSGLVGWASESSPGFFGGGSRECDFSNGHLYCLQE